MKKVKRFSKKEAIKLGWKTVKKNLWFLLGVELTVLLFVTFAEHSSSKIPESAWLANFVFSVSSICLSTVLTIGLTKIFLNLHDKKKVSFSDLYSHYKLLIKYLIAGTLSSIITFIGYLLLIVPGIILSIRLQFVSLLVVDKGMGPIEAIKTSWSITKGISWNLFLFLMLILLINIAGLLALVVGLFISYPIGMIAQVYVYRKLSFKINSKLSHELGREVISKNES
jgi:uncharacterized membrane protein